MVTSPKSRLNFLTHIQVSYLKALLESNRVEASRIIHMAKKEGATIKELYLNVFQTALYKTGELWESGKISVADEHLATAMTQMIMTELYQDVFKNQKNDKTLIAVCAQGELHEVGMRMVSDFFEIEGWDSLYLGANTPNESIQDILNRKQTDLIAVSTTLPHHLEKIEQLIGLIKASKHKDIPIIVGGSAFNRTPDLWKDFKADGFAENAEKAVSLGNQLVGKEIN